MLDDFVVFNAKTDKSLALACVHAGNGIVLIKHAEDLSKTQIDLLVRVLSKQEVFVDSI